MRASHRGPVAAHIASLLRSIETYDPKVRAFCDVRAEGAMADAAACDALAETARGPLHGTGIAIKEIFDVAGCRCAWGSEIHAARRPESDAAIVERIKHAGGIVLGTVTSTEYAMARIAPTRNPHDLRRTPGASSSGSAAAVAAGMADAAIGSQTIGSGIRPAAYCGVFAFKPSHGRLPLDGCLQLSELVDFPVIFARSMDDVMTVFTALADETEETVEGSAASRQWALVAPWFDDEVDPRLWGMIHDFASAHDSGVLKPREIGPIVKGEEDTLATILSADMWRLHRADYDGSRHLMSESLRSWLERGSAVTAEQYRAALAVRETIAERLWAAMPDVDVVVTLATTGVAPLYGEGTGSRAPQRLWNLIGAPAVTGPIGQIDGLPVGIQLVARPGADAQLLGFAREWLPSRVTPTRRPTD